MNRIGATFDALRERNEKALVGFVTVGDPDLAVSRAILEGMLEAGVDVLELGVPFSDPTADGPVIQRSSARALAAGVNLGAVLDVAAALRPLTANPLILFSYYNPLLAYGAARFYRAAATVGIDGLLVVDLPPEESGELTAGWPGDGLALIRLVAPTTPRPRMAMIARAAAGFIYLVSMTGVTGSAGLQLKEPAEVMAELRSLTTLPVAAGFGISTPEQVAAVCAFADGAVVGSAFERVIEEHLGDPGLPRRVAEFARALKAATRPPAG
jgi:tryptophan synthase alpha chain